MKLDSKAVVPIGWVLSGYATIISVTIVGAFWVSSVNYRLERIEDKLGIPQYHSEAALSIDPAYAGMKDKKHDDLQRLSRFISK